MPRRITAAAFKQYNINTNQIYFWGLVKFHTDGIVRELALKINARADRVRFPDRRFVAKSRLCDESPDEKKEIAFSIYAFYVTFCSPEIAWQFGLSFFSPCREEKNYDICQPKKRIFQGPLFSHDGHTVSACHGTDDDKLQRSFYAVVH